jgi:hypothetical protein
LVCTFHLIADCFVEVDRGREVANDPRAHLSLAALLATVVSSPPRSEEQPQTAPTRDVDITYQITRPGQPAILERRRWFASQHLRRVDGPGNSATIFDQSRGELTAGDGRGEFVVPAVLNAANHTYVTLEGPAAKRMTPQNATTLKRGGEYKIAGLNCIDWSWVDDTQMHTACLTPDGVLLRLIIDGQIVAEAFNWGGSDEKRYLPAHNG